MQDTLNSQELLDFVKEKHKMYFKDGVIEDRQIASLIEKIVRYYELDGQESVYSPCEKLGEEEEGEVDWEYEGEVDLV